MRHNARALLVVMAVLTLTFSGTYTYARPAAEQAARNLTVRVGGGQDTINPLAFFPQTIRIRAGDTVTWRMNSNDQHSVYFGSGATPPGRARPNPAAAPGELIPPYFAPPPADAPAGAPAFATFFDSLLVSPTRAPGAPVELYSGTGYVSSGDLSTGPLLSGLVDNSTFSLAFDTPGAYQYLCLFHPDFMSGWVEVVPPDARDVPDQAAIDAQGQAESAVLLELIDRARAQNDPPRQFALPDGSAAYQIRAGNSSQLGVQDNRAQFMDFLPKNLTIQAGDTVLWSATNKLHTVTFSPFPPEEHYVLPEVDPNGGLRLNVNPRASSEARPSAVYDPTQYYNSGSLGFDQSNNLWSLTFVDPGVYDYYCAMHIDLGMKGTITVLPKS